MNIFLVTIVVGLFSASVKCDKYGSDLRFTKFSNLTRFESIHAPFIAFIEVDLSDQHSLIYAINEEWINRTVPRRSFVYHLNVSSGYQTKLAGVEATQKHNLTSWMNVESNASEAFFYYISRGTQINSTHIVLPEKDYHCLRLFDRSTSIVSVLGQLCSTDRSSGIYKLDTPTLVAAAPLGDRLFVLGRGSNTLFSFSLISLDLRPMYHQNENGRVIGDFFMTNTLGTIGYISSNQLDVRRKREAGLYRVPLLDHDKLNTYEYINNYSTKLLSVNDLSESSYDISGPLIWTNGTKQNNQSTDQAEISISGISSMEWLVKDEVLVLGCENFYRLVDLRQHSMTSWCLKKDTKEISQIIANENECERFNGGEIAVNFKTNRLFLTNYTYRKETHWHRVISILHTEYNQLQCESTYLSYTGSKLLNNVTSTELMSKLKFGCEPGYALWDYDTVQCVANESSLYWSHPFPSCQSINLEEQNLYMDPVRGHAGGSYNIQISGLFPLELDMSVRFINGNTTDVIQTLNRSRHDVRFTALDLHGLVKSDIIRNIDVEVTLGNSSKKFIFSVTPLPVLLNTTDIYNVIRTNLRYTIEFNLHSQVNYNYQLQLLGEVLDCSTDDALYPDEITVKCSIYHETSAIKNTNMVFLVDGYSLFSKSITFKPAPRVTNVTVNNVRSQVENESDLDILPLNITGIQFSPEFSFFSVRLVKHGALDKSELSTPAHSYASPSPDVNRTKRHIIKKREVADVDNSCEMINITDSSMTVMCFPSKEMKLADVEVKFGGSTIYSERVDITRKASDSVVIIAVITVILTVVICGFIAFSYYCYKKRQSQPNTSPFNMFVNSAYFTRTPDSSLAVEFNVIIQTKICHMLIPPSKIKYNKQDFIGQGQFGSVLKGKYHSEHGVIDVALKTLTECCTSTDISRFCEEACLMFHFNHPHVLNNIGVVDEGNRCPLVVLPYMPNRDLRALLLNEQLSFTQGDMVHFGLQIAKGMEYLSNKQFVHRDLATRNCLVTEDYVIKIADFGLSRDIYRHEYYKMGEKSETPLPVKWMAIESLERGTFSSASDVWSFGVVLWELMTRGAVPYAHLTNYEAIAYVKQGLRLERPKDCFENLYDLMHSCWFVDPASRPSFSLLVTHLRSALYGCNIEKGDYVRVLTKNLTDLSLALTRAVSEHGINSLSIQSDKRLKNFKLAPLMIPCNKNKTENKSKPFPFNRQLSYSYSDTDLLLQASPGSNLPDTLKMV